MEARTEDRDYATMTVGEIVAADYRAAAVFDAQGIDFCCKGEVAFSEACRDKGLDPLDMLGRIAAARSTPVESAKDFASWSSSFLADYIINTHHLWLRKNTPTIQGYLAKIATVHGSKHPELPEIARIFGKVASSLTGHLQEEEETFFPAIKRLDAARAEGRSLPAEDAALIRVCLEGLGREHEEIGEAVHEIRRLSKGFALPEDACQTYALAYRGLAEFEEELHAHVHLENNILFRKAAGL